MIYLFWLCVCSQENIRRFSEQYNSTVKTAIIYNSDTYIILIFAGGFCIGRDKAAWNGIFFLFELSFSAAFIIHCINRFQPCTFKHNSFRRMCMNDHKTKLLSVQHSCSSQDVLKLLQASEQLKPNCNLNV